MTSDKSWEDSVARIRAKREKTLNAERREQLWVAGAGAPVVAAWTSSLGWRDEVKPPPGMTQLLYGYFDAEDVPLYRGITDAPVTRQITHLSNSPFMVFAVRVERTWYATREEVEAAEREAIERERPIFNRRYNGSAEARERRIQYLREHDRLDLLPSLLRTRTWDRMVEKGDPLVREVNLRKVRRVGDELLARIFNIVERFTDESGARVWPDWMETAPVDWLPGMVERDILRPLGRALDRAEEQASELEAMLRGDPKERHLVGIEVADNGRTYWECDCGTGGSTSREVDPAVKAHLPKNALIIYREQRPG